MVEALVLNVSDLVGAADAAVVVVLVVGELMELATLELLLCWGNGGLLVKTAVVPTTEAAAVAGVTCEIWVSDTDVVIGAGTDTFWAEDEVVETTAEAATAAILDVAS